MKLALLSRGALVLTLNKTAKQERSYQAIRRKILDGQVRSRRDLSHHRLAAELGVSSTCIQMALGRLAAEGLLESRPQSGTYLRQIDMEEYAHQLEVRELMEPHAAGRAAERITPEQLGLLEQACDELEGILEYFEGGEDYPTELDAILQRGIGTEHLFHGTIMEAAGNPTAANIVENLRILSYSAQFGRSMEREVHVLRTKRTLKEHREIKTALAKGDARESERLMRLHIHTGRYRLDDNQEIVPPDAPRRVPKQ